MNGNPVAAGNGGFTLARVTIRTDQDVVAFCRRARTAGEEFGLDPRDLRRLSAALFEVGRQICSAAPATDAELTLGDGPSLLAQVHVKDLDALGGAAAFDASLLPLRGMVHRLELTPDGPGALLSVGVLFRDGLAQRPVPALPLGDPVTATGSLGLSAPGPADDPARSAYDDLQDELQRSNAGLVALYAELDDQSERLRGSEDRLQALLDCVTDYAICALSPAGEVTSWNQGAERLFGYAAEEIVGRSAGLFYPPDERQQGVPAAHLSAAEAEGQLEAEGVCARGDGTLFDAHISVRPLRDASRALRGFALVVRDVTERKRLEDDLRRRAEDLAAANRAKEDFLATLSHELRTPLNAMLGWTRLLRMGKLDAPGTARALQTIERNAHLQEQLIADILDVSRIVTGKLRLELRQTDLAPLLDAAIDALRPAAEAKGVELTSRLEASGTVLGDPDRLQQVVWNLLANALKFTPRGGHVTVSLDRQNTSVVVTVTDTGEGISPELLPFIFDRFRQGDTSVTRPHSGLGLGLSIVRHIVELHGGTVRVSSDGPGRGAMFSIELPVRAIRRAPDPRMDGARPLIGLRILVVDDEPDAREIVSLALTQCGADTAAVASAREALDILPEFKPDVLVSDIRMPGEDGYALIRRIRALREAGEAHVPAVALTGLTRPEDRRRALTAGYQSFVPKPVEVDELAAVIRRVAGLASER